MLHVLVLLLVLLCVGGICAVVAAVGVNVSDSTGVGAEESEDGQEDKRGGIGKEEEGGEEREGGWIRKGRVISRGRGRTGSVKHNNCLPLRQFLLSET